MAKLRKKEQVITPLPKDDAATKSVERVLRAMIAEMSSDYMTLVGPSAKKYSKAEFSDARGGGNDKKIYSAMNAIARAANNKLIKKYSDDKIQKLIEKIFKTTNEQNAKVLFSKAEKIVGISQERLIKTIDLSGESKKAIDDVVEWIGKLRDDSLEKFGSATIDAILKGKGVDYVAEQFGEVVSQRKRHAEMVARTQVATYNSLMSNIRAREIGVKEAIWVTGGDGRVRKSHRDRDGKRFRLDKGLYSRYDDKYLLPGTDFQCRCTYKMILPEDLQVG